MRTAALSLVDDEFARSRAFSPQLCVTSYRRLSEGKSWIRWRERNEKRSVHTSRGRPRAVRFARNARNPGSPLLPMRNQFQFRATCDPRQPITWPTSRAARDSTRASRYRVRNAFTRITGEFKTDCLNSLEGSCSKM